MSHMNVDTVQCACVCPPLTCLHSTLHHLQEELDKQVPIIDDIDKQLNNVTGKLKSNNARLKGLVLAVS
mgnify:CR=1 FL=1